MLQALDQEAHAILAPAAERGTGYCCPACRNAVMLKRGAIVSPHFAHYPRSVCPLAGGESVRHRAMKLRIGELFAHAAPRYEVPIAPYRRADVLLYGRIVVECQASPLRIEEWEQRTRDYNQRGYAVLWVWDGARLGRPVRDGSAEQRVPAEVRRCHRHAYGRVYVLDGPALRACHLFPVSRRIGDGGPKGIWRDRIPRSLRLPDFYAPPARLTLYRGVEGERLVHLGEGSWWLQRQAAPPANSTLRRRRDRFKDEQQQRAWLDWYARAYGKRTGPTEAGTVNAPVAAGTADREQPGRDWLLT
jgi:hypothetical protein